MKGFMVYMNKIPLAVIAGPTASGKTRLAIDAAKEFNGEIVSADSMQIYKYMILIFSYILSNQNQAIFF